MDTRNRPSDAWEQQTALSEWLDELDALGVNTVKVFANEHELIRKTRQVSISWNRYLEEKPDSLNAAAQKAADDPDDFTAFTGTITAGALAADPAVHERLRGIIERAGAIAAGSSYRAFRQRGGGLYKILAPLVQKTAEGIAGAGAALPDGVTDLDSAARVGVEQDWLKLERLVAAWDRIIGLLDAWYSFGIFDAGGRDINTYNATMFLFRDYEQSVATYGVEPLRTMRQIMTCEPALLTLDEIDSLRSIEVKSHSVFDRGDSWKQIQSDNAARKNLVEGHTAH